jgi:hypothetical protein
MEKIFWNSTYGYKDFITEEERLEILEIISQVEKFSRDNGVNMKTLVSDGFPENLKVIVDRLRKRIVEIEKIEKFRLPLHDESLIAIYEKYSYCTIHQDTTVDNDFIHNRYNILLSKAEEGGLNVHDGEEMDVEERAMWLCEASEKLHGTTRVLSEKPRIILSIGFYFR